MLTEDYLIRLINLAVAALARIIGLKTSGDYEAALFLVDQTLESLLGLRAYMIKTLDDAGLLALLSTKDGVDVNRAVVVADIFKIEGEIHAERNDQQGSQLSLLRAMNLYLQVVQNDGLEIYPDTIEKIAEIAGKIRIDSIPDETRFEIFQAYEQAGRYFDAARTLADWIESSGEPEELLDEAIGFYERLLDLGDEELTAGGLERAHALDGLRGYQSRKGDR